MYYNNNKNKSNTLDLYSTDALSNFIFLDRHNVSGIALADMDSKTRHRKMQVAGKNSLSVKEKQGRNQKKSPNMLTGSTGRGSQEVEFEPGKVESGMLESLLNPRQSGSRHMNIDQYKCIEGQMRKWAAGE